eukprot:6982820-Prymnesium_polylepis.1
MPRRGSGGFPRRVATGTEFGANRGVGDRLEIAGGRGRSTEIDRGRPRSTEVDRSSPIFANLRSTSVRHPGLLTQFGRS